jgi:hypothetical protein
VPFDTCMMCNFFRIDVYLVYSSSLKNALFCSVCQSFMVSCPLLNLYAKLFPGLYCAILAPIAFMMKLKTDYIQGMPVTVQFRVFILASHLKQEVLGRANRLFSLI